jgi:hypothetical protein|tara:strand:+ start:1561 stop:3144 length:1584 start_codon:yes stop_codon:yes gene_type:complete
MNIIVIGSGMTGSNVALSLLKKGKDVELWDFGKKENLDTVNNENFKDFKRSTNSSVESLIGNEDKQFPNPSDQKLFETPPLRNFLLNKKEINNEINDLNNFHIYQSFNKGGLANGWGANCIPYNKDEISDWNIDPDKFYLSQKKIFDELNVSKINDKINETFNISNLGSENPIILDERDNYFLKNFSNNYKYFLNESFEIGKARLAIKNSNTDDSCKLTSRCVWGCPQNAIYNPLSTLKKCKTYKKFKYFDNRKVSYFNLKNSKIDEIIYFEKGTKKIDKINSKVFLCAGAIQSGIIFNRTCVKNSLKIDNFKTGLMDTKKVKVVYFFPKMLGKKIDYKSIQFNRLVGAMKERYDNRDEYIHLEFLHLNSFFYQPLINNLPLPLRLSKNIFYNFYSSLGVCTYYLPDSLNDKNKIKFNNDGNIEINYTESNEKMLLNKKIEKRIKKYLFKMSAIPIKTIKYESGAAIHYAGTVPMGLEDKFAVNTAGQVKFINNLIIADASIMPRLSSKPVSINAASLGDYIVQENT